MELELKHIAPYLPYKLPAKLSQQGIFNLDLEYPNPNVYKVGFIDDFYFNQGEISGSIYISEKTAYDFESGDIDILLRPLSDLTKEIEHNGERFFPKLKMYENYPNSNGFFDYFDNYFTYFDIMRSNVEFVCVQKLIEWHFDIFGLIENNLAIDINTL